MKVELFLVQTHWVSTVKMLQPSNVMAVLIYVGTFAETRNEI